MTNIGNSENPLEHRAESLSFDPLTSDPSNTERGEMWLRTDLDDEVQYQIATLRFDSGGGILDIPVYQDNANLYSDYQPILSLYVDGQRAFIPLSEREEASYPQLAFEWQNETMGFNTLQQPSAIPDSVVSRDTDTDSTGSDDVPRGLRISVSQEWSKFGGELSSQTGTDPTRAYIYDASDGTLMGDTDISALGGGDTFTIELDNNLQAGKEYSFVVDAEGSEYNLGEDMSPDYPYESSDGNLEIINGASGPTSPNSARAWAIVTVGNVGFD